MKQFKKPYLLIVSLAISISYCVPPLEKLPAHQFLELRVLTCVADANSCESQTNTTTTDSDSTPTASTPAPTIPPSGLSYNPASITLTVNVTMPNLSPTVTGTVVSYSILPGLPTGVTLNTSTGLISGTPTGASGNTAYTITATNALGNTTTLVNIEILTFKRIFVTAIGSRPGAAFDFTSALTADARCMSDTNKPSTGTYKAMLVDSNRRASISANTGDGQLDWVFLPNISYARPDGAVIQISNAQRLLPFPLILSPTAGASQYFTGMNADWTTNVGGNCSNWTDGSTLAAASGVSGRGEQTGDGILRGAANISCGQSATGQQLLCVEQ
jgi:hypothetical protein